MSIVPRSTDAIWALLMHTCRRRGPRARLTARQAPTGSEKTVGRPPILLRHIFRTAGISGAAAPGVYDSMTFVSMNEMASFRRGIPCPLFLRYIHSKTYHSGIRGHYSGGGACPSGEQMRPHNTECESRNMLMAIVRTLPVLTTSFFAENKGLFIPCFSAGK